MPSDTYEGPSDPAPAPETVPSDDESEIDLGWKPESRQDQKKGKQKSQGQDDSDLQLLEDESKVRCTLALSNDLADQEPLRSETPTAVGAGAFSSDGAGPTAAVR